LRYFTAGESHGTAVIACVEGIPSGLPVDLPFINEALARRQGGYGRGARQKIERDEAELLTGVRRGKTIGSPVVLCIRNKDHRIDRIPPKTVPRPGHADLAGLFKRGGDDIHNVAERASARETAARVAAGALARSLLHYFNMEVTAHVTEIGDVRSREPFPLTPEKVRDLRKRSELYTLDPAGDPRMKRAIDRARRAGDTLGGIFRVIGWGIPPGLGDCTQWDLRLDGRLAQALMSVQAIKGVEIGLGFAGARRPGSRVHDPIIYRNKKLRRLSNNAGGLEGGITNGEPLLLQAAMKPISTLMKPLPSVNLKTRRSEPAAIIRSDVCAVPAASVVGEAVVALEIVRALLEKFGSDDLKSVLRNHRSYLDRLDWTPPRQLALPKKNAAKP
jgi:chorismate synthase